MCAKPSIKPPLAPKATKDASARADAIPKTDELDRQRWDSGPGPGPTLPSKLNPYERSSGKAKGSLHDALKGQYREELTPTIDAKREYREQIGDRAEWMQSLDAAVLQKKVPIKLESALGPKGSVLGSHSNSGQVVLAAYRPQSGDIVLKDDMVFDAKWGKEGELRKTNVKHELRHVTQATDLPQFNRKMGELTQTLRTAPAEVVDRIAKDTHGTRLASVGIGGKKFDSYQRYVTSKPELEVRLGELNDFSHANNGKAITTPMGTVQALHDAGMSIPQPIVERAFKNLDLPFDPQQMPQGQPGATNGKWQGVDDLKEAIRDSGLTDDQRQKLIEEVIIKTPGIADAQPGFAPTPEKPDSFRAAQVRDRFTASMDEPSGRSTPRVAAPGPMKEPMEMA